MAGGKHEPIHQWEFYDEVVVDKTTRFRYICKGCKFVTMNAEPLPKQIVKTCDKKLTASL